MQGEERNFASSTSTMSRAGHPRKIPTGTLLVKDISNLATLDEKIGELKDAAIYVEGNTIAWVGQTADLPEKFKSADEVISLADRTVAPGLVNTHRELLLLLNYIRDHLLPSFRVVTLLKHMPAWPRNLPGRYPVSCLMPVPLQTICTSHCQGVVGRYQLVSLSSEPCASCVTHIVPVFVTVFV